MLRSVLLNLHQEKSGSETPTGSLNSRACFQVPLSLGAVEKSSLIPSVSFCKWYVSCLVFTLLLILAPYDYTDIKVVADSLSNCSLSIWMGSSPRERAVTVVQLWFFFSLWRRFWEITTSEEISGFSVHREKNCTQVHGGHLAHSQGITTSVIINSHCSFMGHKKVQCHFLPCCWI